MPETSLPVRHLYKLSLEMDGPPTTISAGPQGTRILVGASTGKFEGERLQGTVVAPGGDWVTQRADGSMKLDVRITLLTDDGATILVSYSGIGLVKDGALTTRCAPLFETGDERYAWLNNVQAVGVGGVSGTTVEYDIYELL